MRAALVQKLLKEHFAATAALIALLLKNLLDEARNSHSTLVLASFCRR